MTLRVFRTGPRQRRVKRSPTLERNQDTRRARRRPRSAKRPPRTLGRIVQPAGRAQRNAYLPALPGLGAVGDTRAEVERLLGEALRPISRVSTLKVSQSRLLMTESRCCYSGLTIVVPIPGSNALWQDDLFIR